MKFKGVQTREPLLAPARTKAVTRGPSFPAQGAAAVPALGGRGDVVSFLLWAAGRGILPRGSDVVLFWL